ncbi:MAG TPA: phosphoribosylamine--glycine ligase, partial [Terriglobia bacterium]|nr:phosphoribosylamine--glycine ligase [Terriglobia bacterium]
MKILVLGSGGREHAIVWKLRQCPGVEQVYCAPGNGGIAQEARCFPADPADSSQVAQLACELRPDLIFVGPEAPLVAGLADHLVQQGFLVVGPMRAAARLEGSKIFAKHFMRRHKIPTADFVACEDLTSARAAVTRWGGPVAIKADGLAAGKGVVVASDRSEAERVLPAMLSGELVGEAGKKIVLEERLSGEEISFLALTDGSAVLPLLPTQDHKRVYDEDRGPNTGGMGAYSDDGMLSEALHRRILEEIVYPTIEGLRAEGMVYRGILYCGLMITADGPKVIEYNVRFGDPETQALLVRLETNLADLAVAVARGKLHSAPIAWKPGASLCVVACSEGYPGPYPRGREIRGLSEAEAENVKIFHAGTASQDGRLVTSGGRVLGITAWGPNLAEACGSAYQAAAKIHFEGIH